MKKLLRILITIFIILLLPFLLESIVVFFDNTFNSEVKPGAIVMQSDKVHSGLNKRMFCETRFRSSDMNVSLRSKNISRESISLLEKVKGTFKVLDSDNNEIASFAFKLVKSIEKKLNHLGKDSEINTVEINNLFEAEFLLKPSTREDREVMQKYLKREFEQSEKVIFHIELEGFIPAETEFLFSYSQAHKSLLRGTFLYELGAKLFQAH